MRGRHLNYLRVIILFCFSLVLRVSHHGGHFSLAFSKVLLLGRLILLISLAGGQLPHHGDIIFAWVFTI